ncbi:MAG: alpha/beta fold hydrolase [bacterium]|nr:alpha/beta fold hydrolase [bacterium]
MIGELVRTKTSDGLKLQGLLVQPAAPSRGVVLHIHGLEGNFYENDFFDDVGAAVTEAGFSFCTVNTRGAGVITSFNTDTAGTYKDYGASRELINDCLLDIEAWLTFLTDRGFSFIILSGHSLGTLKVVHYQSVKQDSRVKGLILMGAVDYAHFAEETSGADFDKYLAEAKQMIDKGKGDEFAPIKWHSYSSLYDWFSKQSLARIFEFSKPDFAYPQLKSLRVPVLVLQGEKDQYLQNPQVSLDLISKHTQQCTPVLITGADHWYNGGLEQLRQSLRVWLTQFSP